VRFREVFRYELQHTLRSGATWIYPALLFFFAAWIILASYDESIDFNAPIRLTLMAVAASMFGLLVTAGLFGAAAVRDIQTGMDPLLFTTPLSKTEYLGGRFLAALSINAVFLLAIPIGQVAAALLWHRFEPEIIGPYRITVYLQAFPLLLIPGLLFTGGILFTIAMLARQVIPVYLGAIVLFVGGIVAANYVGRIANPFLSALADPFGIATLERMSRYWAPVEFNARLVGFPAPLVWSRVAWLAFSVIALAVAHRRFRFAHDDGGGRRKQRRFIAEPLAERTVSVAIPRVQGEFAGFTWVRQTFAIGRRCFAEVTTSRSFVAVMLLAFGLTLLWGWNVGSTVFDTPVWPVTHLVASVALSSRNLPIIFLIIALWAGEMVWKDRDVGMAEIADASPVSEGVAVLGRFLAVVASLALLTVVIMAAGFTLQALQGYYDFEPGLYFRILFGINFANYVLWAALAMTIHVIVNQKYIGHILMLVFFAFMMASSAFGIDHHLLVYSTSPEWTYSEMNGFGPFVRPFVWFKLYWAAWALLLSVLANVLWVRGREPGLLRRLRVVRERFDGGTARAAAVAIALILVLGGFIYYNTNVLNEYRTPRERSAPQAEYEERYKRFENAPQPTIVSAELRMEIHPEDAAVETRGTFRMVNRTVSPIDSVHVYTIPEIDARSISFDRPAESVLVDDELGFRIYALAETLQPGDSLQLSFDVSRRPRGFPNDGIPTEVVENGAYFNRSWLPMIGYQPVFELSDPDARSRFDLAPRPLTTPATDSAALRYRHGIRNEDHVRVEAIIGTAADQIAVTPGVLRRSWTENGRSYFHYDTEVPESFGVAVVSGRYAVRDEQWNGVRLRIYHHPEHTDNLDRVVHGLKASLEYFTEQFGPFPYREQSIVEVPPYSIFGSAHPGLIVFSETFFNSRAGEGDVNEPFYGTAHEVAHTWWAGMLGSAMVPGARFLSESLANYSAMLLTEKTFGPEMARRVYDEQMNRYLRGRAEQSREVAVLDVGGQPYIAYRKGALALHILRDHIGEARLNAALRRSIEKYGGIGPPFTTSRDLYAELRAVTPDSLHTLLEELFETITLWDLRTEAATVEPAGNGEYRVTLDVVARKVRADSVGNETEVAMDDLIEIGVFAPGEGGGLGEPLYLERHRIRSGAQTIVITVPRAPARAGIDPWRKLFDRARDDNVVAVEVADAAITRRTGG
jgi:hypothetical protein